MNIVDLATVHNGWYIFELRAVPCALTTLLSFLCLHYHPSLSGTIDLNVLIRGLCGQMSDRRFGNVCKEEVGVLVVPEWR
jgi:hypothetical protein